MPFEVKGYIPSVKPGTYQATLIDTEEKESRKNPGQFFRVWHFQLSDGSRRMVDGTSSLIASGRSKGGQWLAALMGTVPADGSTVAPEGRPATIQVDLDDNGYERVVSVLPAIAPTLTEEQKATRRAETQHAIQENDPADALPF